MSATDTKETPLTDADNKKLLWLFTQAMRPHFEGEPILGLLEEIVHEIENRLVPEYNGETYYMTDRGWVTPEGEINYI